MAVRSSDDWRTGLRHCSIRWAPIRKRYETGIAMRCSASWISFRVRSLPDSLVGVLPGTGGYNDACRGFTHSEMRVLLAQLLGFDPANYPAGKLTYDLRRLRLHGIIERIPHSHRYRLTPDGLPYCAVLLQNLCPPAPAETRPIIARGAAPSIHTTHRIRQSRIRNPCLLRTGTTFCLNLTHSNYNFLDKDSSALHFLLSRDRRPSQTARCSESRDGG